MYVITDNLILSSFRNGWQKVESCRKTAITELTAMRQLILQPLLSRKNPKKEGSKTKTFSSQSLIAWSVADLLWAQRTNSSKRATDSPAGTFRVWIRLANDSRPGRLHDFEIIIDFKILVGIVLYHDHSFGLSWLLLSIPIDYRHNRLPKYGRDHDR